MTAPFAGASRAGNTTDSAAMRTGDGEEGRWRSSDQNAISMAIPGIGLVLASPELFFWTPGIAMESVIDRIAVQAQQQPQPTLTIADHMRSDQLRLVADDKRDLDEMIQVELNRGWFVVSRSYSLDDGHGATLIRKALASRSS